MTPFQAAILGLIQGLTEFIPVSSSAHLVFLPWLLGWPEPGIAFDVALHVGTLIALLIYFSRAWARLAVAGIGALARRDFRDPESRLGIGIVLGTLPAGIAGLLGEKKIDALFHADDPSGRRFAMLIIAAALAIVGFLMLAADRLGTQKRGLDEVTLKDSILIGFAQALALIPGMSRSGSTITAGLARGLDRGAAARFSFLLAAPIMAGAGLKKGLDLARGKIPMENPSLFAIGLGVSAVTGILCIHFLLRYLQRHSTSIFVWYRLALAAALVGVVISGR